MKMRMQFKGTLSSDEMSGQNNDKDVAILFN